MGGGGFEGKSYKNVKIYFQDIDNIHVVRNALNALRAAYAIEDAKDKVAAAEAQWNRLLVTILNSAKQVVEFLKEGKSILLHCSDGWDRTAQSIALAEMIIDPYYRTFIGFIVLIEKEFCSFGHQFARRHGHGFNIQNPGDSQRSPIFTQFFHCVIQFLRQFPMSFEFNESLLLFIMEHIYSCRFGTFLFDHECHRMGAAVPQKTVSLWSVVLHNQSLFLNPVFTPHEGTLDLSSFKISQISMLSWNEYYKRSLFFHTPLPNFPLDDPFLAKPDESVEENPPSQSGKSESSNSELLIVEDKKSEKKEDKRKSKKGSKLIWKE